MRRRRSTKRRPHPKYYIDLLGEVTLSVIWLIGVFIALKLWS